MLGMLVKQLDVEGFSVNPWKPAQQEILTHLDTQLEITWAEFEDMIDIICDDFNCTRFKEIPEQRLNGEWVLTIHKCTRQNTTCKISEFMADHKEQLKPLLNHIDSLDKGDRTAEIDKIRSCLSKFFKKGRFEWEGTVCSGIGDLLIGMQSLRGKELLSSNKKEHTHLSKGLGYTYREFPVAEIRQN